MHTDDTCIDFLSGLYIQIYVNLTSETDTNSVTGQPYFYGQCHHHNCPCRNSDFPGVLGPLFCVQVKWWWIKGDDRHSEFRV